MYRSLLQIFSNLSNPHYTLVDTSVRQRNSISRELSWTRVLTAVIFAGFIAMGGFLAGSRQSSSRCNCQENIECKSCSSRKPTECLQRLVVRTISEIFKCNRTFSERPTLNNNKAWDALFPEQGGFFKHPSLAPTRSAFAVFHQLHCLVILSQP